MTASSRFLAWLVLPMIAFCSFNALAETSEGAPKALHLLDYIGADYPATVEAGKVIDESEYREQQEFLKVLQGLIVDLPAKPEREELEQGVSSLGAAIAARKDGADVARQARQLGAKLAVTYEVSQAPVITHCTTGTQQQDALALEAEPGVDRQIPHQSGTIGVVAQQAAIGQFAQGVHRTGPLCPRRQAVREAIGVFLERHSYIRATTFEEKRPGAAGKIIEGRERRAVVKLLRGLLGEQAMNQWRLAVANRVTENDITVHQHSSQAWASQSRSCRKYSVSRASSLPGSAFQS